MSFQPPAPPPGSSDDPGWQRDRSPYGRPAAPPPAASPTGSAPGQPSGWPGSPAPPPGPPPAGYPPYGYQPYGQPGYGFGAGQEHPQGTTILVLGILSLVVCQILGPVAWAMGNSALREIDGSPGRYTNRGSVVAGRICGIVATVLLIVSVALVVIVVAVAVAAGTSS